MTSVTMLLETETVTRLRAGDEEAFAKVVQQYSDRLLAIARRLLRNEEDAADAVQDGLLSAFRGVDQFAGSSTLATWLHRVVVNACLMKGRSISRRTCLSLEDILPKVDAHGHPAEPICRRSMRGLERLLSEEARATVRNCIAELRPEFREVVILRDIEEMETETVAELLGVSTSVIKTRLHRARRALRSLLERKL